MNYSRLYLLSTALVVCSSIFAQTSYDAARLYGDNFSGTARYIGMGGAMAAFGNDISVIKSNPAGIGTYKQNEANISLSFTGNTTKMVRRETDYISDNVFTGNIKYDADTKKSDIGAYLDNLSFVMYNESSGFNSLRNVNFAFSYRKLNNINRGINYYDDLVDYNEYRDYGNSEESKIGSYDFNISFNQSDLFYWGFTFGIIDASYWSNGYYYHFVQDSNRNWQDYTSVDRMNEMSAKGFDMALGMIFRPIDNIRLGASLKTPTWYSVDQTYQDYLYAVDGQQKDGDLFSQSISYNVTSPWVMNLSAGLTFDKTAIGFEYEKNFADRVSISQSGIKMNDQGGIDLSSYETYKVGIEQNIDKISLRAGYSFTSSKFNSNSYQYTGDSDFNKERRDIETWKSGIQRNLSFGVGYCSSPSNFGEQFYVDAAYVIGVNKSKLSMGGNDIDNYPNPYSDYYDRHGKLIFTAGFYF